MIQIYFQIGGRLRLLGDDEERRKRERKKEGGKVRSVLKHYHGKGREKGDSDDRVWPYFGALGRLQVAIGPQSGQTDNDED